MANTTQLEKTVRRIPDGVTLRKLDILFRDTLKSGEALNLENEETATEFGLKLARIQAMKNGDIPVELPDRTNVVPIQEKQNEKMRNRVQFFVHVDNLREAKIMLRRAYQLEYMPSCRSTEDPTVKTLSIYYVRFTAAERFFAQHTDKFIKIECTGKDVDAPTE